MLGRVIAVLHCLGIVQILKDALAEGDSVLIDEDIRGRVCCEVEHLQIDIRKIDDYSYSAQPLAASNAKPSVRFDESAAFRAELHIRDSLVCHW